MSFTTEIKNEVALLDLEYNEKMVFLSGFVRNNGVIKDNSIVLVFENVKVVRKIILCFKELFDVSVNVIKRANTNFSKKSIFTLEIKDKVDLILKSLMIRDDDGNTLLVPKDYFIMGSGDARAYLSGAFLASGSINDPSKARYHMEFLVEKEEESYFIVRLLAMFFINAKVITRDKGYMTYVKEAEKIGDFLRVIGASRAVMYYEDIRIYRDHKNMTNRLNNCEQANVDKLIMSANRQIEDINIIVDKLGIDLVDERLREVIDYRLKYPDVSLAELSVIMSNDSGKNITKSGLNHRFRKIKEMADRLRESKEN